MIKVDISVAPKSGTSSGDSYIEIRNNIAYLAGTSYAIWVLVGYRRMGISMTDLHRAIPSLSRTQLQVAMDYYRGHKSEIDYLLSRNSLPTLRIPLK
ncbi:MAG: DUF433 domain-containing protein [Chloroflexi bacterium]|nr:DUF433 domain-containing protein [Chloroflexota bacterium]